MDLLAYSAKTVLFRTLLTRALSVLNKEQLKNRMKTLFACILIFLVETFLNLYKNRFRILPTRDPLINITDGVTSP